MSLKALTFISLCAVLPLTACTRGKANSSATFRLSLPETRRLGDGPTAQTLELEHVIINISGPGIDGGTIICGYDARRQRSTGPCNFAYPSVSIRDLKPGSGRVVQVLVMYSNSDTGLMSVSYGDALNVAMNSGENVVSITLVDQTGSGRGGHIWGRYLTGTNSGPDGTLEVRVRPNPASPPITLMRGEVFNGFFQGFSLEFLGTEYLVNGSPVFAQPQKLVDLQMAEIASPALVNISESFDGYEIRGFFGAPAFTSGKYVNNDAACIASTNEFLDCFTQNSRFQGPFADLSEAAETYTWAFLPGVGGTAVDSVYVYRINYSQDPVFQAQFQIDDSLFNCNLLKDKTADPASGVTLIQTVNYPALSQNIGLPLDADDAVAFCPAKAGVMYQSALVEPDPHHGGGGGKPYVRLEGTTGGLAQGETLVKGDCIPVRFAVYQAGGGSLFCP